MKTLLLLAVLMSAPDTSQAPIPNVPELVACYSLDRRELEVTGTREELRKFHTLMLNTADFKWENNALLRAESRRAKYQIIRENRLTINVAPIRKYDEFSAIYLVDKTARDYKGYFKVLNPK